VRKIHLENTRRCLGRRIRDRGVPFFTAPNYNVAPIQEFAAVVEEIEKRKLEMFHGELIPSWAKDPAIGNK
jgi:putative SOS response-associated peptidase YedK